MGTSSPVAGSSGLGPICGTVFAPEKAVEELAPCSTTRTLGYYKNHPEFTRAVIEKTFPGDPTNDVRFTNTMNLLNAIPGGDQSLILQRALRVTLLNIFAFGIGGCTLADLGLDPNDFPVVDQDKTVTEIRQQGTQLFRDILRAEPGVGPTRDLNEEPLTSEEKEALTAKYEVLDAINNSRSE